jgi:endonuclease/exonuclease/phosphatase family metal-dependent hydrolase
MSEDMPALFTIMTYNILVGGNDERLPAIEAVLRSCQPDIVGLQEVTKPDRFYELADRLGMYCIVSVNRNKVNVGLLSRWPITDWIAHERPIFQKGLIEAVIELPGEPHPWHIFVCHLTADFFRAQKAERHRREEILTILDCMEPVRQSGFPHVLLGDFNSLAPGEKFDVTRLLAQIIADDEVREQNKAYLQGRPNLGFIIPRPLHPFMPLFKQIPRYPLLAGMFAFCSSFVIPRLVAPELTKRGYIDCLRVGRSPREVLPTCPEPRPAGRIDYIWADPILAQRLQSCDVVVGNSSLPVEKASDHRPVIAQFARVPYHENHKNPEKIGIGL